MRATPPTITLRLRLICMVPPASNPPDGEEVCGLQDRHGQLDAGAVQPDGAVQYDATVQSTQRPGDAHLRFTGLFVHGPSGAAFLYLSVRDPRSRAWVRRLKIPLGTITQPQVAAASATAQGLLLGRIAGSGSGTVALLDDGWIVGAG